MHIDLSLNYKDIVMNNSDLSERAEMLFKSGHFGTHLDIHNESEVPLDYMFSRGLVFDVSHVQAMDIELNDFKFDKIKPGDFVIFKTDMIKRHAYGSPKYFQDHPQLSDSVIDYLITQQVRFIGIDAAGVRRGKEHVLADRRCEDHGVYIIENLSNLDALVQYKDHALRVTTLWIDMPSRTGLPCRVVVSPHAISQAVIEEDITC